MSESVLTSHLTALIKGAEKLRELELMKAHSKEIHSGVERLESLFDDVRWTAGREQGSRCTKCGDGFYNADHCTECGHEQYQ